METRFTIDGSSELEKHLSDICEQVRLKVQSAVPGRSLEAIALGGGYGRGQGGVLKTKDGDRPYNDLEFYVFIRGNYVLCWKNWASSSQPRRACTLNSS